MSSALTESRRLALRSASRWYAVLSDNRVNPRQEVRWQQWYEQSRDHQWAWQQVENLRQQMGQLPGPLASRTLNDSRLTRRQVLKGLMLLVAAGGGYVPMISGRGLGHTGGTLDKLEAIPGFDIFPDDARFRGIIKDVGVAIIGQTSSLAPADKRFYATRDITATVDSIPLITASILAKKLAEGLDALVMDVKVGSGAFMPTYELSAALAEAIVGVSNGAGVRTTALLTDMNQVLASSAGNAVEVREAVRFLTGEYRNPRLFDVTMALCVEMLISGKLAQDDADARAKLQAVLDNGKAAELFGRMVAAQKGPTDFVENYDNYLPTAMLSKAVYADGEGFVAEMDTRALGMAVVSMGGGRRQASDPIDYSVGFTDMARLGDSVDGQSPLAVIHAKDEASWQEAAKAVKAAIKLDDKAPKETPTVYRRITE